MDIFHNFGLNPNEDAIYRTDAHRTIKKYSKVQEWYSWMLLNEESNGYFRKFLKQTCLILNV